MSSTLRCALGRVQPGRPDPEEVKRDGWQQQQIMVVAVSDDRLNWFEREMVRQIGEKLYGPCSAGSVQPTAAGLFDEK